MGKIKTTRKEKKKLQCEISESVNSGEGQALFRIAGCLYTACVNTYPKRMRVRMEYRQPRAGGALHYGFEMATPLGGRLEVVVRPGVIELYHVVDGFHRMEITPEEEFKLYGLKPYAIEWADPKFDVVAMTVISGIMGKALPSKWLRLPK